jgi:hypothetical protein
VRLHLLRTLVSTQQRAREQQRYTGEGCN